MAERPKKRGTFLEDVQILLDLGQSVPEILELNQIQDMLDEPIGCVDELDKIVKHMEKKPIRAVLKNESRLFNAPLPFSWRNQLLEDEPEPRVDLLEFEDDDPNDLLSREIRRHQLGLSKDRQSETTDEDLEKSIKLLEENLSRILSDNNSEESAAAQEKNHECEMCLFEGQYNLIDPEEIHKFLSEDTDVRRDFNTYDRRALRGEEC